MSGNKPIHEVRIGRVKAAVWQNDNGGKTSFSASFSKLYKDEATGKWASTESFGRDDLLVLAKVADQAHSFIVDQNGKSSED